MTETLPHPTEDDVLDQQAQIYEKVKTLSRDVQDKVEYAEKALMAAQPALEQEDYDTAQFLYDSACQALRQAEQYCINLEAMDPASLFRHARSLRNQTLEKKPLILNYLDQAEEKYYQSNQLGQSLLSTHDAEQKGNWDVLLYLAEYALAIRAESVKFSELRNQYQGKKTPIPKTKFENFKQWLNKQPIRLFAGFATLAILLAGYLAFK
jgi:hypothetical protein